MIPCKGVQLLQTPIPDIILLLLLRGKQRKGSLPSHRQRQSSLLVGMFDSKLSMAGEMEDLGTQLHCNAANKYVKNVTKKVYDKTSVGAATGGPVEVGHAIRELTNGWKGEGAGEKKVAGVGEGVTETENGAYSLYLTQTKLEKDHSASNLQPHVTVLYTQKLFHCYFAFATIM
ncbi:hypothetical protein IEQ34_003135 [Dendrobium chrysotoxum]|uniref:Uncharacterized protein n=1 Tax=Dendrobium chrysotoxum TaxID=161865 RepID=A0AAV7HGQ0_DENCH|nr:hypothetical protein IEQ34_003135 [Dendrobium chrysotoxum]